MNAEEPALLLRLRRLREERALRERVQALGRRDAAQARVQRRRDELQGFDADLAALAKLLAAALAATVAGVAPYASARRDDLAYRRERCEYDLIDDEEALAEAQRALDEAALRWRVTHARSDAAQGLLQRVQRNARRAAEHRLERDEPARRPALAAPSAHTLHRPTQGAC